MRVIRTTEHHNKPVPNKKQQAEKIVVEENIQEVMDESSNIEQVSSGGSSFVSYLIILAGLAIILAPIIFK
jgi:hypothetical protein